MRRTLRWLTALGALSLLSLAGCETGGPSRQDAGPRPDTGPRDDAAVETDAGEEPGPSECTPEGEGSTLGAPCVVDGECDDGCFCNGEELCMEGVCVAGVEACAGAPECVTSTCDEAADACDVTTDDSVCDDGAFCNGAERCDARAGCLPGVPPFCGDGDICTVDFCDDAAGECAHEVLDNDGDGFPGTACGGLDCDDSRADVSPDASEICGNGRDDDCNGTRDLADPVCLPQNDLCTDPGDGRGPIDITPSGLGTFTYESSTGALNADYAASCDSSTGPDAVFTFSLSQPRDVGVAVRGVSDDAVVMLREAASCADAGADLKCLSPSRGEPAFVRRSLSAGDYAILVATDDRAAFTLELSVAEASGPQTDVCTDDALDIGAGGSFGGDFDLTTTDDYRQSCGDSNRADAVLRLVVPDGEARDVTLEARSFNGTSGRQAVVSLVSDCDAAEPALSQCAEAPTDEQAARLVARDVPGGTYWVIVEGEYRSDTSWSLEAAVEPAAGRVPGDACDAGVPVDITSAPGVVDLSTLDGIPDEGEFCGANGPGYRDLFFTFTLAEERDVVVHTESSDSRHWAGVSDTCGAVSDTTTCYFGAAGSAVSKRLVRAPAGTYFVNVSTLGTTGTVTASLETFPPTPPPANDACDGSAATPLTDGGTASFDLSTYTDTADYACGGSDDLDAYFTFTIAERRNVNLRAEGAGSLVLLDDACTPIECQTGSVARIERDMDAGTYLVAVEAAPPSAGDTLLRYNTFSPSTP